MSVSLTQYGRYGLFSRQTVLPLTKGPAVPAAARRFMQYVEASPSPFHATASSVAMLEQAGFTKLHEHQSWDEKLYLGGRY